MDRRALIVDYGERLLLLCLVAPWFLSFWRALSLHPQFIAVMFSELFTLYLIFARRPGQIVLTPYAIALGFFGTAFPLLVRPDASTNDIWISSALMFVGLLIEIYGKLSLNRSFGLVAANRGVKTRGAYAIVRHPVYAGYLVTHIGFLISSPTLWNLTAYSSGWILAFLRIREEEKVLSMDPEYRAYSSRVRYRLIPTVF